MTDEEKQEMAEWIAEEVLGLEMRMISRFGINSRNCVLHKRFWISVVDFIFSPDGFFAVWDAVEVKYGYGLRLEFNRVADGRYSCYVCKHTEHKEYAGGGKDRYEAFYNAVKQAWEVGNE